MQSVCLAHSEKAGLDLAPSGLLNHTQFSDESTVWPSKAHIFTSEMSTDGHIRAGCYGSQSRRPEKAAVSRLPLGGAQNPNLKRARAPRTRGQASCLSPRWLPRAPPTMWQPHSLKTPHLLEPERTDILMVFWPSLWQKFHLLKYSFYVESQLNDHCKGRTLNWKREEKVPLRCALKWGVIAKQS